MPSGPSSAAPPSTSARRTAASDDRTDAVDAIANVMHWLQEQGIDPAPVLQSASRHFDAEKETVESRALSILRDAGIDARLQHTGGGIWVAEVISEAIPGRTVWVGDSEGEQGGPFFVSAFASAPPAEEIAALSGACRATQLTARVRRALSQRVVEPPDLEQDGVRAMAEPGRLTRASIHSQAGDVELRLSLAGNWVLAIRREGDREWHVACSGDLNGGARSPAAAEERDALRCGELVIDTDAHKALVGGEELRLSRLEDALLATLATQPCRVFSKRELMQTVWGYDGIATRTLDSHASRLRVKLRRAGASGFILNTKQVGYRLWDGVG